MNKILKSKKILFLLLILAGVTFGTTVISTLIDYRYTSEATMTSLKDVAEGEKGLIETLNNNGFSKDSILSIIRTSKYKVQSLGKTGEFAIAEFEGDSINFLSRKNIQGSLSNFKVNAQSGFAAPMILALNGNSGSFKGKDYRGEEVFAGYTFFEPFNWGIVAKIETSEVYRTFNVSMAVSLAMALVFTFLGALLFIRVTTPMLNDILKSEEKFRNLFNNSEVGMFITRLDGSEILEFNEKYLDILGYTQEEVKGNPSGNLWADKTEREKMVEMLKSEGRVKDFECDIINKQGNVLRCITSLRLYRDRGILEGSIQDITSRKKAEEKLLFISKAVDSTSDSIGISDAQGHHFYQNKSLSELFEFETAEELDAAGGGPVVVKDPEVAKEMFMNIMSGKSWSGELEMITKSGRVFPAYERADAIFDNNGKLIGLIGIITDFTERKMAEKALRESEYFFRESQRAAFIGSYKTDFKTGMWESSEVLDQIFGIENDYIRNIESWTKIIHPDDQEMMKNYLLEDVIGKQKPFYKEYRIIRQYDGEVRWVFGLGEVGIAPDGHVVSLIGTIQDITDRKQVEEIISAKNKELENYLYIASHDLRSPLVNIQGFSQRLKKKVAKIKNKIIESPVNENIKSDILTITDNDIPKTLDFIFTNVTKMDNLINGLLQISRTDRILMTIKKINMNKLIESILKAYKYQTSELSANVDFKELPFCYGDENLLNQLFSNIISNSIKYRNKNSQLNIEISARIQFNKVIYKIKDNGIGIAPRHIEKIWDVFYRVDPSGTESGEGIGLSIVKRIADKHKGKVWVESEEGKGTAFYIELQKQEFSEL